LAFDAVVAITLSPLDSEVKGARSYTQPWLIALMKETKSGGRSAKFERGCSVRYLAGAALRRGVKAAVRLAKARFDIQIIRWTDLPYGEI
jgi:hypothetical protein